MQIINVRAQLRGRGTEGMVNEIVEEDRSWHAVDGGDDGGDATTDSLVGRIVSAVATRTGRSPNELTPLYSVVDPDALATLVDSRTGSAANGVSVTFAFEGCRVAVRHDGGLRVEELNG